MKTTLESKMFRKSLYSLGAIAFLIMLVVIGLQLNQSDPVTWYGYVVGEDRRIYMVNLESGELEWISEELEDIGYPSEIEFDRERSILYIASGPEGFRRKDDYAPLVAVRMEESPQIVFKEWISENYVPGSRTDVPVYYVRLNSDSSSLFVCNEDFPPMRRAILDPTTAQTVGYTPVFVRKQDEFSPDNTMLAQIYPGRIYTTENGAEKYPGVIIVWDLLTGEQVSRTEHENNENLYPPWEVSDDRLIFVHRNREQSFFGWEVYDRKSGELLARYAFNSTFNAIPQQRHVTRIPGSDDVVMTMSNYVIVFDPLTAEIKTKTFVADMELTEVVVTDKPLITTN